MESKNVGRSGQPALASEKDRGSNRAAHSKGVCRYRHGKHLDEVVCPDAGAYVAAAATNAQRNVRRVVGRRLCEQRFKVPSALDVYGAVVIDEVAHVMPNAAFSGLSAAMPC